MENGKTVSYRIESGMAVLKLEQYNELRDFKQNVLDGKSYTYARVRKHGEIVTEHTFLSQNDAVQQIADANEAFKGRIVELEKSNIALGEENKAGNRVLLGKIKELENRNTELNQKIRLLELAQSCLKRFSIWQFLKWRKNK